MSTLLLIIGLLLFVGLVIVHEFGHFIAAKRSGVDVEEFGIGFPPRAKVIKKSQGTVYSLNWLPLGGFVRLKGEHDSDKGKGTYGSATTWNKVKIMTAGVIMNLLAAFVILTILALTGLPKANLQNLAFYNKEQFSVASDTKVVSKDILVSVEKASPAAKAGIEDGDQLLKVGEDAITSSDQLPKITEKYKGQTVDVVYVRNKEQKKATATLNAEKTDKGYLGVYPSESQTIRATWSAPIVGAGVTLQYAEVTVRGLGFVIDKLVGGEASVAGQAVGGPVATVKVLSDTSSIGLTQVLLVIALISISLAVMNILPIPALDGGRLFVTLIYRALRKPLTVKAEELIHGTGFALVMILFIVVTIVDIFRIT